MKTKHRAARARERAGLTVGQAAKLLDTTSAWLVDVEASDEAFGDVGADMIEVMCDVYGVRVEWLRGDVPLHDYTAVDGMRGAENLSFHDRDVIAEFAASMPRGKARKLP